MGKFEEKLPKTVILIKITNLGQIVLENYKLLENEEREGAKID